MKIRELFEDKDNGSLIGKRISGKLITTETKNEFWSTEFNCSSNNLTSLEGAPQKIGGDFDCSNNKNLTSLKGMSQEGVLTFQCSYCNLSSLEGAPKKIDGNFSCVGNTKITSLKGMPQEGVYTLICSGCALTSLEGAPKKIDGNLVCTNTNITSLKHIYEIFEEINGGTIYLSDSIESDILGLLKIKNLKKISFSNSSYKNTKEEISDIINKYLPNPSPSQIIDCQNELIDAGFEEYAEM